ncbi:hypothetical protein BASA81_007151 [Batrachochytrium salamandrivorans]|nr:hypothetical protein BASA81_007151 [Batrachochytrium salamandrivorans]
MGGICHHLLPQQIHTWYWRLCWRMCVGAVAASGGALGVCGSELMQPRVLKAPTYVWVAYGAFYLGVTWLGFFSMKNPACDLFLTGVSQSIPTLYVAVALVTREYSSPKHRSMAKFLLAGLLCNIALLPGYDVLNYLGARDGINNISSTHSCISWSCQGVAFSFLR